MIEITICVLSIGCVSFGAIALWAFRKVINITTDRMKWFEKAKQLSIRVEAYENQRVVNEIEPAEPPAFTGNVLADLKGIIQKSFVRVSGLVMEQTGFQLNGPPEEQKQVYKVHVSKMVEEEMRLVGELSKYWISSDG